MTSLGDFVRDNQEIQETYSVCFGLAKSLTARPDPVSPHIILPFIMQTDLSWKLTNNILSDKIRCGVINLLACMQQTARLRILLH